MSNASKFEKINDDRLIEYEESLGRTETNLKLGLNGSETVDKSSGSIEI